jgi:hypothetical protein
MKAKNETLETLSLEQLDAVKGGAGGWWYCPPMPSHRPPRKPGSSRPR